MIRKLKEKKKKRNCPKSRYNEDCLTSCVCVWGGIVYHFPQRVLQPGSFLGIWSDLLTFPMVYPLFQAMRLFTHLQW